MNQNEFIVAISTPRLVCELQQSIIGQDSRPLNRDGFFGPKTGEAFGAAYKDGHVPYFWDQSMPPSQDIRTLQRALDVQIDGYFGPQTGKALGVAIATNDRRLLPKQSTNAAAIAILKDFEKAGWEKLAEFKSYRDMVGVPTIGFGHTLTVTGEQVDAGWAVPPEHAERLLKKDLQRFEVAVQGLIGVPVGSNMFSAMVLLAFNIGASGLAKSTVRRLTNAKDFAGATDAFLLFDKVTIDGVKQVVPGLTRRRRAESELYRSDLC